MTIILFLIDTSASMCQKAHVNGVQKSYLDIAKGAVETFLKYRQRSQDCMGDRYMLLTFEEPPSNVKAGWKENHATFMNELKNLQSNGLTTMGEALKNAFDLLNLNRMQSGIDTYGQGRCPFYLEPSVIIVITDGGRYSFRNGVHQEIILPLNTQIPGTKLTKEPFRWDQRLFSLVLRMAGNKIDERMEGKVPHDEYSIEKMCEVTGGRSYKVRTQYVLNQCIESLVQKVQPGVVIHFDALITKELKDGECQDLVFQSTKKMIYVQKHPAQKTFPLGFWPIPEPYWPDSKMMSLPPRDAHPKIRIITPCVDEPQIIRNFPIDKYELEASPLTLQILSKKDTNKVWPLLVVNSNSQYDMRGIEMPFGYLKANTSSTLVHLYVLPYNYPTLLPLIHDLLNKYNMTPPSDWIYKFSAYVKSIPQYYCPFLRRALNNLNIPYQLLQYILPENLDSYLSPTVANYLKQMKNTAKQDQENLCLRVFKQLKQPKPSYHRMETVKLNSGNGLKRDLVSHPMLKESFSKLHSEITTFDNYTIVVPTIKHIQSTKNFRNPFDIPRRDLIDEISRMRDNFFKPTNSIYLYTKDAGHTLPIAEMGNYQEYLKNKETPLRELEPTNTRQHMFGNPYKKDKHMVMVDEADVSELPLTLSKSMPNNKKSAPPGRKRKAGPIPKNYVFKRARLEHHFPASPTLPQAPPNILTDTEDETASESSSIIDTDDESRLTMDFDEPEEFTMNGDVQKFLNGDMEDNDDLTSMPYGNNGGLGPGGGMTPHSYSMGGPQPAYSSMFHHSPYNPSEMETSMYIPDHYHHSMGSVISPTPTIPANGTFGIPTQAPSTMMPMNVAPIIPQVNNVNNISSSSNVVPTTSSISTPTPSILTFSKNDMNDAQEISKILQQSCQNGSNNSQIGGSIAAHTNKENNNNNNSNNSNNNNVHSSVNESNSDNSLSNDSIETSNQLKVEKDEKHQHLYSNGFVNNNEISVKLNNINSSNSNHNLNCDEKDDEYKEWVRLQNLKVRTLVFKDIRRPGRNYSMLLKNLESVKGNFATQFSFVQMCIEESLRFRRHQMAKCIREWWEENCDTIKAECETNGTRETDGS